MISVQYQYALYNDYSNLKQTTEIMCALISIQYCCTHINHTRADFRKDGNIHFSSEARYVPAGQWRNDVTNVAYSRPLSGALPVFKQKGETYQFKLRWLVGWVF